MNLSQAQYNILRALCEDSEAYVYLYQHSGCFTEGSINGERIANKTWRSLLKHNLIEHDKKTCPHPKRVEGNFVFCFSPTRKAVALVISEITSLRLGYAPRRQR